jgi:hypothetical protein
MNILDKCMLFYKLAHIETSNYFFKKNFDYPNDRIEILKKRLKKKKDSKSKDQIYFKDLENKPFKNNS